MKISLWHTVRGKLIILGIGVELLMLTVMVVNSLRLLHGAMADQAQWQAEQMAPVLNAALTAPLVQRDYATVEAVIKESRAAGGVIYIAVLDRSGRRVACSGWPDAVALPQPSQSFPLFGSAGGDRYHVQVPITEHEQPLGTLCFGLDLSRIVIARQQLLTQGISIAILELALSSLIMLLIGYWLTRHLTPLTEASLEVAEGNLTPAPVPEGVDDLGRLGVAFNTMSRAIAERVHELTGAKEALLARAQQLELLNATLETRVQLEVSKNREKDQFLMQHEKLASLGQLAAGVAHEINNPMGFITSNLSTLYKYLERLSEYLAAQEEALAATGQEQVLEELKALRARLKVDYILKDGAQLIDESQEGGTRVRRIVQDLKTFSRLDQPDRSSVDLNECIETTINIAWNEIKYVATLNRDYGTLPPVQCYPQQINQVLLNLMVNAAQALNGHGEITIRTWSEAEDAFVAISDTGKGIPEEIKDRIFEPFFTTKEVGQGTGLGLSISYDIVMKHRGEIKVDSTPGEGTTFTVRLPIGS